MNQERKKEPKMSVNQNQPKPSILDLLNDDVYMFLISLTMIAILVVGLLYACAPAKAQANEIVKNAILELGNGEVGGDNKGTHVTKYTQGQEVAWCAGFTSYVLTKSNIKTFPYNLSAKKFWNQAKELNLTTAYPTAGDLIVFWRENPNSWKGHVGIVERVTKDTIYTIEGNVGEYPAKVKRFSYPINDVPNLLGFVDTGK